MKLIRRINKYLYLLPLMVAAFMVQSCTEKIDTSARYTFTGNTILSYLEKHSEDYSEYCDLLDIVTVSDFSESKVSQLLTARGNYTCFAPTNEAIQNYLVHLKDSGIISEASWNAPEFHELDPVTNEKKLLKEIQETIVYNSLIDAGDDAEAYQTSDFSLSVNAMLGLSNMMNRKLKVTRNDSTRLYAINGSTISGTNCDIYTINGRIHQVDKVIAPSTETGSQLFDKITEKKLYGFYAYAALLKACGLYDILNQHEDEEYYKAVMTQKVKADHYHTTQHSNGFVPERRYIGFTLFAEGDDWWETTLGLEPNSITSLEPENIVKMISDYVVSNGYHLPGATTGTDYTDEKNALNQFVTYHLLPAKIEPGKLVIHYNETWYNINDKQKGNIVYDYYTTMGKRRLLKTYEANKTCTGEKDVIWINRFPKLNNARNVTYVTEESCDDLKAGVRILTSDPSNPEIYNGYIYKIDNCLYFNEQVAENMGSERIRIDGASMFKEFITNDIRCNENLTREYNTKRFPSDKDYKYFDDMEISENTYFFYFSGRESTSSTWYNYQGDELHAVGNYEITMKLPPVPKDGVYELRIGTNANDQRGMCQIYWGTNKNALPAAGIPLDMRMGGFKVTTKAGNLNSISGYEDDQVGDDDLNAEIDKKMRNNSFMKAPNSIYAWGSAKTLRGQYNYLGDVACLRRIVLREEMKSDETYYIQFKSVLEDVTSQFYFDYIELCPKNVYDNPETPEDIW